MEPREKVPDSQNVQNVLLSFGLVPAEQYVHCDDPAKAIEPAGQIVQPKEGEWYDPAAQTLAMQSPALKIYPIELIDKLSISIS